MTFVGLRTLIDTDLSAKHCVNRRRMQFSIRRLLCAIAVFAIAIVCFQRAAVLSAHALETMRGAIPISGPAVLLQWLASSLAIGGIATIAFGRKGLLIGTGLTFVLIPVCLLIAAFIRSGNI